MSVTSPSLISTFGRRRGRKLRAGKQQLMDEVLPRLSITLEEGKPLDPRMLFANAKAIHLEIGFGGGEHLAAQAAAHPEIGFIGCEPYVNGIGNLLKQMEGQNNIRLFTDDARLLIAALPDTCLDKVYILFPDPWPKSKHHKRRLIQPDFLKALHRVIKPDSELLLATDHADYLTWMLAVMTDSPYFTWTAKGPEDWQNPPEGWVETGYQRWARTEGRDATYLVYKKA